MTKVEDLQGIHGRFDGDLKHHPDSKANQQRAKILVHFLKVILIII